MLSRLNNLQRSPWPVGTSSDNVHPHDTPGAKMPPSSKGAATPCWVIALHIVTLLSAMAALALVALVLRGELPPNRDILGEQPICKLVSSIPEYMGWDQHACTL